MASTVSSIKRLTPDADGKNRSLVKIVMSGTVQVFTQTYAALSMSNITAVIHAGTAASSAGGSLYFDGTVVGGRSFSNDMTVSMIIHHK